MWLSEKNGQGETGWKVVKEEFSVLGSALVSTDAVRPLAKAVGSMAVAMSLAACVLSYSFNHIANDWEHLKDSSHDNSMVAAYDQTDFKKAAMWGAAGGALSTPFMLSFIGFSDSRKKWQAGNVPKDPAGPA